ncbi:hypothetical protein [Sandaracinus amylolyticus]|uniref:hypothetical protein n=1 Tax=Sandaracinus amylolyticus TaxID=927083 RepID=UPI001F4548DC|nr:hypothetical protein [Sandaracinus amylolyticus]UJR84278.1 Hypothetical protein I5071_63560 [Sandaracinus amylolyticus]
MSDHGDDITEVSLSFPLDPDGYLRRECPTCERELKRLHVEGRGSDVAELHCPYCGVAANTETSWFTPAQLVHMRQAAIDQTGVGAALDDLERSIASLNRTGGMLRASFERPERPEPLAETNDMRAVSFACHPDERIKVLDDWTGPVHCTVCGETTAP